MTNLNPIDLPLDDGDRLADPPLIDSFRIESSPVGFSIIFIPSDEVSSEEKESIFVRTDSTEGRLLLPLIQRMERVFKRPVGRILHSGGGNYTLTFADGTSLEIDDGSLDNKATQRLFDILKHMAQVAECAFAFIHAPKGRVA